MFLNPSRSDFPADCIQDQAHIGQGDVAFDLGSVLKLLGVVGLGSGEQFYPGIAGDAEYSV